MEDINSGTLLVMDMRLLTIRKVNRLINAAINKSRLTKLEVTLDVTRQDTRNSTIQKT
jgi:uncharacterized protein GlcG (DUF336 family)